MIKHSKIIYSGKAKDMNHTELWLYMNYGRKVEQLEPKDFSTDTYYNKGVETWKELRNS